MLSSYNTHNTQHRSNKTEKEDQQTARFIVVDM
jgi:hypothetical protein